VHKSIKRLINSHKTPNLAKFNDISELILQNQGIQDYSSGSEMDDIPESRIVLPEDF